MRSVHQHIALLCKASGEEISGYSMGSIVDFLRIAILMAHPVLAMMLIWAFMRQRSWRHQKIDIEEKDMVKAVRNHEKNGNRIMAYLLLVIAVAFSSRIIESILFGEGLSGVSSQLIPGHYHGWSGILALVLMTTLWYMGRKAGRSRADVEEFTRTRDLHGRLGDVMAILVIVHAFLGFLYLLQII